MSVQVVNSGGAGADEILTINDIEPSGSMRSFTSKNGGYSKVIIPESTLPLFSLVNSYSNINIGYSSLLCNITENNYIVIRSQGSCYCFFNNKLQLTKLSNEMPEIKDISAFIYGQAVAFGNGKIVITLRMSPFSGGDSEYLGIVIFNYNSSTGFSFYKSYKHTSLGGQGMHRLCYFNNKFYMSVDSTYKLYSSNNGENFSEVSAITENCLNLDCNSSYLFVRTPYGLNYSTDGTSFSLLSNTNNMYINNVICSDIVAVEVKENDMSVWKQFQNGTLTNILYSYNGYYHEFRQYGNYQLIFITNQYFLIIKNKNTGESIQKNYMYGNFATTPVINNKIFFAYGSRGISVLDLSFMQI